MLNMYRLAEAVGAMQSTIDTDYMISEDSNMLSVIDVNDPGVLIQESNAFMADAKLEVVSAFNEASDVLLDEAINSVTNSESLVEASLSGMATKIKEFFAKIIQFFKSLLSRIIQFFKDLINKIKGLFSRKVKTAAGEKTVQQIAKEAASGNDPMLPAEKKETALAVIDSVKDVKIASGEVNLPTKAETKGRSLNIPTPPDMHTWGGTGDGDDKLLNLPSVVEKTATTADKYGDSKSDFKSYSTEDFVHAISAAIMGRSSSVGSIKELFSAFDQYYIGNEIKGGKLKEIFDNATVGDVVDFKSNFNVFFKEFGIEVNQFTIRVDDAKKRFTTAINNTIKHLDTARREMDAEVVKMESTAGKPNSEVVNDIANRYKFYQDYSSVVSNLNTHGIKIFGMYMNELNSAYSWLITVRNTVIKNIA